MTSTIEKTTQYQQTYSVNPVRRKSNEVLMLDAAQKMVDVGVAVDEAALSWFRMQHRTTLPSHDNFLHPLCFIRYMLLLLCTGRCMKMSTLLAESRLHKKLPSQHINDRHFMRSVRYLGDTHRILLKEGVDVEAGNIVVFSQGETYMRMHWAICGNSGRLYHVNEHCDKICCSQVDGQLQIHLVFAVESLMT